MGLEGKHLGQYRLLRLLGSGGMGEVYLAEDARIGQTVAIKVSRAEATSYPSNESTKDAFRLFQREAKAIAQLDHPRILPLYGYGEEHIDDTILTYIIMPYRREGTFAAWLQQRSSAGLLPIEDVNYFIHQAADALQYAHDNHIVHQDVKPTNFLLRGNKEYPNHPDLLLADFGIAKLNTATIGTSQTIRGTPAYMAPEQWSGAPVPASDQYALAVLAYELLTGCLPFTGRQEQLMYQHFNVRPQPPSYFNPALPKGIDAVILKALEKRPADRFPSIAAFAQALQQATSDSEDPTIPMPERVLVLPQHQIDETVPAVPNPAFSTFNPSPATSAPRQQRFSRMKATLLIGLILLVLVGGIGYFYLRGTTSTTGPHTTSATTSQTFPYPPPNNAMQLINDSLNTPNNLWEIAHDPKGACQFTGGVYEVSDADPQVNEFCRAWNTDQHIHNNFAYEAQMTIVQGDVGGLRFTDDSSGKYYYFGCRANDGYCSLVYYADNVNNAKTAMTLLQSFSSAFRKGLNQPNLLAVKVQGSNIGLYVNGQLIDQTDVGTFGGGSLIGVFAREETNPTVVNFSNAKVWLF